MGNRQSSYPQEIIYEIEDDLESLTHNENYADEQQENNPEEAEIVLHQQEEEIQIPNVPEVSDIEIAPSLDIPNPIINNNENTANGPKIHTSPIIKSVVSLKPDSVTIKDTSITNNENSPKQYKITLDKEETKEEQEIFIQPEKEQTNPINFINLTQPFQLEFTVDCETDCAVNIYWGAQELKKSKGIFTSNIKNNGEYSFTIEAEMNRNIIVPPSKIPKFTESDINKYLSSSEYHPLIIQLLGRKSSFNNLLFVIY